MVKNREVQKMIIKINIANKRPVVEGTPVIVCGNSDYFIEFTFDEEWDAEAVKTARFAYIQTGVPKYQEVVFSGNTVQVPVLSSIREVMVGVYAGELRTTAPARIPCERSILCGGGENQTTEKTAPTLQAQIGDLKQLSTQSNGNLVAAVNEVYKTGSMSATARGLLLELLQHAVYTSDMSEEMEMLEAELSATAEVIYAVTNSLAFVISTNGDKSAKAGGVYIANLAAVDKYVLEAVTVTMGGVDITASVYDGRGEIVVPMVTGDIVVTASAAPDPKYIRIVLQKGASLGVNHNTGDISLTTNNAPRCTLDPILVYMKANQKYHVAFASLESEYFYGLQLFGANVGGMNFIGQASLNASAFDGAHICDFGWKNQDGYEFNTDANYGYALIGINFRRADNGAITDEDIATITAGFELYEV